MTPPPPAETRPLRTKLPRAIVLLGLVSLFTDAAADMVMPLVPKLLLALGGGPVALGWLEGIAEAVASVVKWLVGRSSDRMGRRKPFVVTGYLLSALSRPVYALIASPLHAVLVRAADRAGKGLRGPPRDAWIADVAPPGDRARAFGFHRMMDNLGGVLGPLIAFVLLQQLGLDLKTVFVLSVIPGLLSVAVALVAKEPAHARQPSSGGEAAKAEAAATEPGAAAPAAKAPLPWGFLLVSTVFALASSGDLFLLSRLSDLGLATGLLPIAWVSLQLAKSLFNLPGGRLSDRFGKQRMLVVAWVLYAASYAGFAGAPTWWIGWATFLPYAAHYGLAEGGQRALLADLVPAADRGRAYGTLLALEGAAVLPANVGFGWLYQHHGAETAFFTGAGIAVLAALGLALWRPPHGHGQTTPRS